MIEAFSRIQRDKVNGSASGTHKEAISVQLDRYVMVCVLYASTFLLNAGMKLVFSFCMPVAIQSTWVLTQAYSPLGYLSFHHHLLLNLSS
jgi:hypothetical protein